MTDARNSDEAAKAGERRRIESIRNAVLGLGRFDSVDALLAAAKKIDDYTVGEAS